MTGKKDIKKLLDRYMAGESTVDEINKLADYFRTHKVKREWRQYQMMFAYFDHDMDWNQVNCPAKITKNKTLMIRWLGIAAAVAAIVVFMIIRHPSNIETDLTAEKTCVLKKQGKDEVKTLKSETEASDSKKLVCKSQNILEKRHLAHLTAKSARVKTIRQEQIVDMGKDNTDSAMVLFTTEVRQAQATDIEQSNSDIPMALFTEDGEFLDTQHSEEENVDKMVDKRLNDIFNQQIFELAMIDASARQQSYNINAINLSVIRCIDMIFNDMVQYKNKIQISVTTKCEDEDKEKIIYR